MADDANGLLRFALISHEGGHPEIAAEIFRRILVAYPSSAESHVAVYYLTGARQLPPNAWSVARDSSPQESPAHSKKPIADAMKAN